MSGEKHGPECDCDRCMSAMHAGGVNPYDRPTRRRATAPTTSGEPVDVEGLRLVPIEPTREMWAAAGDAVVNLRSLHHDALSEAVWTAMLSAAPPAPNQSAEIASLKAAVEEARGALEAAESENEELRLLMLGGEDVPGVAASLSFDQVRQAHEDNRAMRVGRAESAERSVASLKAALETDAAKDVLAERRRQVETEGWTLAHDDEHAAGDMARAAACYALSASRDPNDHRFGPGCPPAYWPWDPRWWKPTLHRRRELVKAGALIIAEIERLDRLAKLPALNAATLSKETGNE